MPLNEEQRQSLEQLWAVTASNSDASRERDERLLRENGFDVQVSDSYPRSSESVASSILGDHITDQHRGQ